MRNGVNYKLIATLEETVESDEESVLSFIERLSRQ